MGRRALLSLTLAAALAQPGMAQDAGSGALPPLAVPPIPRPETPALVPADDKAPPSSGALIPPEAYDQPVIPLGTPRPAAFETLRESDFDHAACRLGLVMLGVDHAEVPPLTDPDQRDCGIARPVELRAIQPGITVEGSPVLRCDTARALALWLREMVVPAASRLPGSPRLTSVITGPGYACRGVVGGSTGGRISEHALGNAIDIAGFGFDDGSRVEIAPTADRGDLAAAFQNAVQGSACLYFTTVLGPGSNAAHDDHLHLDIKARQGGFRLCQ
ncbi:extensin family protein [Paracoccus sp. MC1854]|uniref:extensin-like domain-containing protein n=1 Tax=Paracoccus sp. MC1854 TaxID=2760306 RepID=UPI0016008850|nr:extensin family protein [Paracoccus sp. MC1854]MBB1490796.1 extensin family protein [Paracoccus sp. MC1854]